MIEANQQLDSRLYLDLTNSTHSPLLKSDSCCVEVSCIFCSLIFSSVDSKLVFPNWHLRIFREFQYFFHFYRRPESNFCIRKYSFLSIFLHCGLVQVNQCQVFLRDLAISLFYFSQVSLRVTNFRERARTRNEKFLVLVCSAISRSIQFGRVNLDQSRGPTVSISL